MKTKTTLGFLPEEDSFRQHFLCANYQAKICSDFESTSSPEDPQRCGSTFQGQYLLPVCHVKVARPDLLQNLNTDESNSDSERNSNESNDEDLCKRNENDDGNKDYI